MSMPSLTAVFNSERSAIIREGCEDGWFDHKPEPDESQVFFEHRVNMLEGRTLWLNESTHEFVVTEKGGNTAIPPTQFEKEEAQRYWDFLARF